MKLSFAHIQNEPKIIDYSFKVDDCELHFNGDIKRLNRDQVMLKGLLNGEILLECDICTTEYKEQINENLELLISEKIVNNGTILENNIKYDIIECFNGIIDLDEIVESEINLIKLDYHKCKECE